VFRAGSSTEPSSPYKLIQVPADEVVPGDHVRDHGSFREVIEVQASVREGAVVLVFEQVAASGARLHVPLLQTLSVWRACRER
jgi:hypothetical protein